MNHDEYRDLLLSAASGGIDPDEQAVLESHLRACDRCRQEYGELRAFHEALIRHRVGIEADERLLEEARRELRIRLRKEAARGASWWSALLPVAPPVRLALGATFVLALGFFLGRSLVPPPSIQEGPAASSLTPAGGIRPEEEETKITNVHFLDHGRGSGEVEFTFDAVTPVRMRGRIDDPKIQKVLTYAMLNEENPGVRLRAIDVIRHQAVEGQDVETRSALIKAMERDANAGVRKEALNALRRLPFDGEIKKALLHTLMVDSNPGLRVAAINALDSARTGPLGVDSDMLDVLKHKAETDNNNYIRVKARAVIQEVTKQ
jgi:hypothetical protein